MGFYKNTEDGLVGIANNAPIVMYKDLDAYKAAKTAKTVPNNVMVYIAGEDDAEDLGTRIAALENENARFSQFLDIPISLNSNVAESYSFVHYANGVVLCRIVLCLSVTPPAWQDLQLGVINFPKGLKAIGGGAAISQDNGKSYNIWVDQGGEMRIEFKNYTLAQGEYIYAFFTLQCVQTPTSL